MKAWRDGKSLNIKKSFPKNTGIRVDQLTFAWLCRARAKQIPVSGKLIKAKAKEIAFELNIPHFKASNGWLQKFLKRNNIALKTTCGEAASVNKGQVDDWIQRLPAIIQDYEPKNIFNTDETGLVFQALPSKTYALKREKCIGGKLSKQRITVLHCCNMLGHKEPLLIIGKSRKPRCFKNVGPGGLPVKYESNKKAWMTRNIMKGWLGSFDNKMRREDRKILLFLDNATSHTTDVRLKNIKLIFLPPNTTSICQPLDQGIIKCFKTFYRQYVLKNIIANMEDASNAHELASKINILDAIIWSNMAWNNVTAECIQNCFKKAGFGHGIIIDDFEAEDDLPLSVIKEMQIIKDQICLDQVEMTDFITCDTNVITEDLDDLENHLSSSSEEDEPEIVEEGDIEKLNIKEAYELTKKLYTNAVYLQDTYAISILFDLKSHYENKISKNVHQTKITDFFL